MKANMNIKITIAVAMLLVIVVIYHPSSRVSHMIEGFDSDY